MDLTSLLIGAAIGLVLAYILFYLLHKSNSVPKQEYDTLTTKLNDTVSTLKLTEDRLKSQQELAQSFQQKVERKESELSSLLSRTATLEATLNMNGQRLKEMSSTLNEQTETNRAQQAELNNTKQKLAEYTANNAALLDKLNTQKEDLISMQKTAVLQFEKLAQQIFEEKSGKFTEANKNNIEALLKPLNENINTFKQKVEETYDKESKQRFSLEEKVKDLIENTQKISQEANNLASALKGQAKKQGDWGETILERILEVSGLEKNREYFIQENLKDEQGQNQRPDIIVRLPDDRNIIIDSKVSLNAYLRYSEADSKEQQDIFIANHLQAINQHIDQLSAKKYEELTSSLDFVIMFIPVEPAYILAVQSDPDLWAYAYTRRILMISPTNLIAVLKIVADLWKREMQSKNAVEIAREGANLYDKFVGFVSTIEDIGRHLSRSQDAYLQAVSQLKDGRGNLISRVQKLRKLGVKSTKQLPTSMLTADLEEEEEIQMPPEAETGEE
ncbi:MAG: DNA recombination protein RmuC [Saprospiraceae bacterium]|nr:DNA recombination protein RmuC [Candidatus Opimibacter skivensis]